MIRLFIDSSVLFSAAYSSRGHARDLLMMAAREEVILVISPLVVNETRRNLVESAPAIVGLFDFIIKTIPFEFVQPTKDDVVDAAKHAVLKDAPILAAARKAQADMLVTLDKKHLLEKPELEAYLGRRIVMPKAAVNFLKSAG